MFDRENVVCPPGDDRRIHNDLVVAVGSILAGLHWFGGLPQLWGFKWKVSPGSWSYPLAK
jgi:hypothetical protein